MASISFTRVCQQRLTHFAQSTSKADFLEQILRVFQKTTKFCFLLQEKGEEALRLNTQATFFVLVLTGASILTDLGNLAKKENWI